MACNIVDFAPSVVDSAEAGILACQAGINVGTRVARHSKTVTNMEDDGLCVLGTSPKLNHFQDEHEPVILRCPDRLPSPVETALVQYADSMESLSAGATSQSDLYTRGFVAGLRAAIKVVANTMNT
jgi:hypothetical protein